MLEGNCGAIAGVGGIFNMGEPPGFLASILVEISRHGRRATAPTAFNFRMADLEATCSATAGRSPPSCATDVSGTTTCKFRASLTIQRDRWRESERWLGRPAFFGIAARSASAQLLTERNSASDNLALGCIQTYFAGGMMWLSVAAIIASK